MMGALGIGIASFTAGCSDKTMFQEVEDSEVSVGKGFMLHATNGSDTDTRLAFGEDGLTLKWEDGDQLYMVNQEGGEPIPLTTSLSEPSSTAVFYSESAIPAGTYYVMYNNQNFDFEEPMFQNSVDVTSQLKMYSKAPLVIEEGAKEANVTLQRAQAMITFNLTNMPTEQRAWYIGMATSDGWVSKAVLTDNTLNPVEKDLVIGTRLVSSLSDSYRFTVLPKNLEGKKITFFVASEVGNDFSYTFYELEKDGKNLQAGYNYNISLDGSQVTPSEIVEYDPNSNPRGQKITSTKDFKQLARLSHLRRITAFLTSDLSFSNERDFLPLDEASLDGCEHTVSGVSFDGEGMDNVGLVRSGKVSNLTMDNVSIKGRNNVGAFMGYVNADVENCTLQGVNNSIVGAENVGGISGCSGGFNSFSNCKVEAAIQGKASVGGICGSTGSSFNRCFTKGSVSGDVNVGGILGWSDAGGNVVECGSSATVEGTDANIGGICGSTNYYKTFEKCYSEGTVSGKTSVGGICGLAVYNSINKVYKFSLCYTTGNVSATESKAGGILGSSERAATELLACYSLGDITASSQAAGIIGFLGAGTSVLNKSSITYCYSVGEVGENGSGIVNAFTNLTAEYLSNCATWASTLSPGRTDEGFVNCTNNAENNTIREALSQCTDFNKYYSVCDWDGGTTQKLNDCPLLLWQVDGINVGTGEDPLPVPPYQDGGDF